MRARRRKEHDFIRYYERFLSAMRSGKRVQKNGKRLSRLSISNYQWVMNLLKKFSHETGFHLRLASINRMSKREYKAEQNYWKRFYTEFSGFMYRDGNHVDNYIGNCFKLIRAFFNYLNHAFNLNIGNFHKDFYPCHDNIQIVVVSPERLNFLIYNKEFEEILTPRLKRIKDIFVFGCRVALRVSDLLALEHSNLEYNNGGVYLKVTSKKTLAFTRVKLPDYALEILGRLRKGKRLIPPISLSALNLGIKQMSEKAGWTEEFPKTRLVRGVPTIFYRDSQNKIHYRFCDLVSSHTMRRTAITTLLTLGMDENLVRMVSGHAPGSKEFYKYVRYAQPHFDKELEKADKKLLSKRLDSWKT